MFDKLLQVCHNWPPSTCDEEPLPAEVSVHAIKNTRRKMEDKHVILPMFGKLFQGVVSTSFGAIVIINNATLV